MSFLDGWAQRRRAVTDSPAARELDRDASEDGAIQLREGWVRRHWRAVTATPAARELDRDAFSQMQRLADACNDQAEAVGKIYDTAGVSRPQRMPLRGGR